MAPNSLTLTEARTLRRDLWWIEPMLVVLGLGSFIVYATGLRFRMHTTTLSPICHPSTLLVFPQTVGRLVYP